MWRQTNCLRALQRELHRQSLADPEGFWLELAKKVSWDKMPQTALRSDEFGEHWFEDGRMNMCYNCLDVHVDKGFGDSVGLRYDSPVSETQQNFTYAELTELTSNIAGMLLKNGVGPGDRVMIYSAMTPEAICTMMACARIGAVHVVCFGGFASKELAKRIVDAEPKLVVASSCGFPAIGRVADYKTLLERAIDIAGVEYSNLKSIIHRRHDCDLDPAKHQVDFYDALAKAPMRVDPVSMKSTDPLYIMYTSGTTGAPKGVVRDIGGYATAMNWSTEAVLGINRGDVLFAASDIGWVVGHSFIAYGPLLRGAQSVAYEGKAVGTPNAGALWRLVEDHKVKTLFCAPTGIRSVKREDPEGEWVKKYDMSTLECLFLAGERSDQDTIEWAERHLEVPAYDHFWQTESGWPILSPCAGLSPPARYHGAGRAVPGWDIAVIDDFGNELEPEKEMGALIVKRPLPPGMLNRVWGKGREEFARKYLTYDRKAYRVGDAGFMDKEGHVHVLSRTDDIMNVSGVRLSTGMIEEAIASHQHVAEAVVVGLKDKHKGEVPITFFVLKAGTSSDDDDLLGEFNALIRDHVGGFARLKTALRVDRLPKTRSGKIFRTSLRKLVHNEEYVVPSTIEDPASLAEIQEVVFASGI